MKLKEEVVKKSSAFFDIPDLPKEHVQKGTWSFGDFGAAPDPLKESTGACNYNFESSFYKGALKIKGIFKDDNIYFQGKKEEIEELQWISGQDFQTLMDQREHPWKNGFWMVKNDKSKQVFELKNNAFIGKQIAQLEYPDLIQRHMNIGTL